MIRKLVPVVLLGLLAPVTLAAPAASVSVYSAASAKRHQNAVIESVDFVSSSDVWAVGERHAGEIGAGETRPLIKHWDGSAWRTTPSYSQPGYLHAVAAVSSDDVWAVGETQNQVLVLHWDGTAWTRATTPLYRGEHNYLTHVSFTSPTNVLVHGYYYSGAGPATQITLVWNGSRWREGSGDMTHLVAIDALSPRNAWGVGDGYHSYAAHWNGKVWKEETPTPNLGTLSSVTTISRDDVWAAGNRTFQPVGFFQHWDGTSWTAVDDPHAIDSDSITGVSGIAGDDVWASGYVSGYGVLEHWDGEGWSDVANPGTPRVGSRILDVVAISATDAWAVGSYEAFSDGREVTHKLLMHWDGTSWSDTTRHQP